jgi:hypothetical protein
MLVYCIDPIDFWSGWHKPQDIFKVSTQPWGMEGEHLPGEWASAWIKAQALARRLGWEGDCREGPYVTVIPGNGGGPCPFIIAWKQDNNGTTFVASPVALPWLDADDNIEG